MSLLYISATIASSNATSPTIAVATTQTVAILSAIKNKEISSFYIEESLYPSVQRTERLLFSRERSACDSYIQTRDIALLEREERDPFLDGDNRETRLLYRERHGYGCGNACDRTLVHPLYI